MFLRALCMILAAMLCKEVDFLTHLERCLLCALRQENLESLPSVCRVRIESEIWLRCPKICLTKHCRGIEIEICLSFLSFPSFLFLFLY